MVPRGLRLGISYARFEGSEKRGFVRALHNPIAVKNPFSHTSVRPERYSVRSIERVSHRVIVVIVGVERAHNRPFAEGTDGVVLQTGTASAHAPFDQQVSISSNPQITPSQCFHR